MYLHLTVWCNVQWCVSSLHSNHTCTCISQYGAMFSGVSPHCTVTTHVPASHSMVQCSVVCLHSNQIASIVEEDLRLRDLEELYLSKNQITHVPERFMASMLALKVLDISHNQLGTYMYMYIDLKVVCRVAMIV